MLTDKDIEQHAAYIMEELERWRELEGIIKEYPEIEGMFIGLYKHGYHHCLDDHKGETIK